MNYCVFDAHCDTAMELFLRDGEIPRPRLAAMVARRQLFPCFFGSALKMTGIEALLDGLRELVPAPAYGDTFAARVYKISHDPQGARLTWMKITGGGLKVKSLLRTGAEEEKVNQIRLYSGARYRLAEEVSAGTVCAITGPAATRAGDGLGAESAAPSPLLTPVFSYQVLPAPGTDPVQLLSQLRQLEEEDPQLHVVWKAEKRDGFFLLNPGSGSLPKEGNVPTCAFLEGDVFTVTDLDGNALQAIDLTQEDSQ